MSGVGAEPVKQSMDTSRIDNLARSQHPLVRDKVREKLSETISKIGISPESGHAMKFFLHELQSIIPFGIQDCTIFDVVEALCPKKYIQYRNF